MEIIVTCVFLLILTAVGAAVYLIYIYNSLVRLRQSYSSVFSNVDVQLLYRYDLIPQIVAAAKSYMDYEGTTFKEVVEARQNGMAASSIDDKVAADKRMTAALGQLRVTFENYPGLKANEQFQTLMRELSDTENKLAAARRSVNSAAKEYNIACELFPNVLVAKRFGHEKVPMFDITDAGVDKAAALKAPNVGAMLGNK
ncbi:MAG: LemA family protein [Chitinispirillia bacterium]|nr:LemA family protein [Chitinispirillia bacterium]MCL2241815.1 LemA family protein [Chitinispirillia bacterium]